MVVRFIGDLVPQYFYDRIYDDYPDLFRRPGESSKSYIWRAIRPVAFSEETKSLMLPNDRQDVVFGTSAVFASYVIQVSMVTMGSAPIKAVGWAWITTPMMDPFTFGMGVYVSNKFF